MCKYASENNESEDVKIVCQPNSVVHLSIVYLSTQTQLIAGGPFGWANKKYSHTHRRRRTDESAPGRFNAFEYNIRTI